MAAPVNPISGIAAKARKRGDATVAVLQKTGKQHQPSGTENCHNPTWPTVVPGP
jgi:hypothetical protein